MTWNRTGAFQRSGDGHSGDAHSDERLADAQEKSAIRFPLRYAGGLASRLAISAEKPPQHSGIADRWTRISYQILVLTARCIFPVGAPGAPSGPTTNGVSPPTPTHAVREFLRQHFGRWRVQVRASRKEPFYATRECLFGMWQTGKCRERNVLMVRTTEEVVLRPPGGDIEGRAFKHRVSG